MKEILRIENLSYKYDTSDDRMVLKNINIKIHEKEKIAIVGNNGAGKSTFFLCCTGVNKKNTGSIYLGGALIDKKNVQLLRESVGIVFQDADNQIIAPTVESEVSFGPMNLKLPLEQVKMQTDQALESMNLQSLKNRPPHYLSGGEKKRVTIADILAMNPKLILMDEPTASLDINHTKLLEQRLKMLHNSGISLMISTHDMNFVFRWADRIIVLVAGEIIADGEPQEIFCNDEIILKAGLCKPILLEVAQNLHLKLNNQYPKNIDEFKKALTKS